VNNSIFGASDVLEILNIGAGVCTITAGSCSVSTTGTLALVQNAGGRLVFTAASTSIFQADGVAATSTTFAIFNETQASTTQGGSSVSGSLQKRTLNTTVINTITGCSIASSVITLPAGTFLVEANAPFLQSVFAKIILRNTTASTNAIIGLSAYVSSAEDAVYMGLLSGTVTTTASTNFELQYQVHTSKATQGLGVASSFSSINEIYATIKIEKIS
jgi:glucose/arabinose dehydrogenase